MTKDFSKFTDIINQFRGKVSESNFDARFSASSQSLSKTEKFLLKMELKRLSTPCTRLIDLRGLVDGECIAYEYAGGAHFLDDIAIKTFKENLIFYGDYTFGVYEAVRNTENNFRVIYQNEKLSAQATSAKAKAPSASEKRQYPAIFHPFGQHHNRKEERMNFAIGLRLILENNEVIDATSSDLSVDGCKFRLKSHHKLSVGQRILIRFIGLENEFDFGKNKSFDYQICLVYHDSNFQSVVVNRLSSELDDRFGQFLKDYIQGNKYRYKINLDNTISALKSRTLEQFVLPKSTELPVFIEKTKEGLLPRYVLTTNNSQDVLQYWQDENRNSVLHYLMKKERIAYLASAGFESKTLLVFSFVSQNKGRYFFYTADEQELKTNAELTKQFLGFAASKTSFAVTELNYLAIDPDRAESLFTVSGSLIKNKQSVHLPLSDDTFSSIDNLQGIVVATDITHAPMISEYKTLPFDTIDKALLKNFRHKRLSVPLDVFGLGVNYKNQRHEPRFEYKTPVLIEDQGLKLSGESLNFSASGLRVEVNNSSALRKGNIVYLSFQSLQKISSDFDLSQLPYEVIQVNKKKTIINLKVSVKQHQHIGRSFFKLLIEHNKDKLKPNEYSNLVPGLSHALRNLYASSTNTLSLIIQNSGRRYKTELLTSSTQKIELLAQMSQLSDRKHYYNLYPLLNNLQITNLFYSKLKEMLATDEPFTNILYIAINHDIENVELAVTTKLENELTSPQLKNMFISNALKRGVFFCIQTKLSRTNRPNMEYLIPELNYISSYAIHRGKQIEQEIWSVAGVLQLIDITKETLYRHQLIPVD
jgi:hypothetical protein